MKDNPIDWMILSHKDDSRIKLRFLVQFEINSQAYLAATKENDEAEYVILKVTTQNEHPELHEIIDDTEWHQVDLYLREHYADLLK